MEYNPLRLVVGRVRCAPVVRFNSNSLQASTSESGDICILYDHWSVLVVGFAALQMIPDSVKQTIIMDQLVGFDAILFPSDGRPPHLVQLMTSPMTTPTPATVGTPRLPHPEVHMEYIAEGLGPRAWRYHVIADVQVGHHGSLLTLSTSSSRLSMA
jgi:hypothetical protein